MAVSVWNPIVTATTIGDPTRYEYGPSVITEAGSVQRVWCTAGRNTDTLSSIRTDGTKQEYWVLADRLVADPCAMRYGTYYLLAYTVGDLNGQRNGVGCHWVAVADRSHGAHRMLIEQTPGPPANPYGIGQPAIAAKPFSPTVMLSTTTLSGVNRLQAHYLHVPGPNLDVALGERVPIIGGDDGASVDAWWLSPTRLAMVVSNGTDTLATRTYTLLNGSLVRDTGETQRNGLWGRTFVTLAGVIDGAGIVRGIDCQPILNAGALTLWVATGDRSSPATWQLRRTSLAVPA